MAKPSSISKNHGVLECHCGTKKRHEYCCGPFISGVEIPQNAEQLMRSRYSAYVSCNESYLLATWHTDTRPSRVRFNEHQRWLGLRIKSISDGRPEQNNGTVEFVARFKIESKGHRLHELSRFEKVDGRWYYRDGDHL